MSGSLRRPPISGLEGIVSKRATSRYCSGTSRSWLKTKNMVESEFVLLGTDRDSDGVPWGLLASDRGGRLEFAGPAILRPAQALRAAWRQRMAELAVAMPPVRGLKQGTAQWLRPELRVRVRHLKARACSDTLRCGSSSRISLSSVVSRGRYQNRTTAHDEKDAGSGNRATSRAARLPAGLRSKVA